MTADAQHPLIRRFEELTNNDTAEVGGKNASLGEMIQTLGEAGVRVPGGFATTAHAYRTFIRENDLEERIHEHLDTYHGGDASLKQTGKRIRKLFRKARFNEELEDAIRQAYRELSEANDTDALPVAARSSATAEDLPEASFAGQQETFLNIADEDELLKACKNCFASLFTDRAISYREEKGFDHLDVALSVGVQKMVRAGEASSGVMFSIDTETGWPDAIVINAAWGLGETVVQGTVTPDEFRVFKPLLDHDGICPIIGKDLGAKQQKMIYSDKGDRPVRTVDTSKQEQRAYAITDDEVLTLARWAVAIEKHYGRAMDMEWAKDAEEDRLYIVQARPETVQSQAAAGRLKTFHLKDAGNAIVTGLAIGSGIATGPVKVILSPEDSDQLEEGDVLVTERTDPDWVPLMKRAAAIVTDRGGRTSHAAIVSRELGRTAVVGAEDATELLKDGSRVTVSCAEGAEGKVYEGELDYESHDLSLEDLPASPVTLMLNIATPAAAAQWWQLPVKGVGLARMEFIINNRVRAHPMALCHPDRIEDEETRSAIDELTRGYDDKREYFVDHLSRGIAAIAAVQHPDRVIVRMSDFKTNEYADLLGGSNFEPHEENPMLGFRGASRYYHERYREAFDLECQAIKRARQVIGLKNIAIMIPFVRTLHEVDKVFEVLTENALTRGEDDLEVYMMCEIPSNAILASEFAKHFDGFSIGTNDLTQLILGVDRDSALLRDLFDERNDAVKLAIRNVIEAVHASGGKVGICGQAPSDYPDFARFLVDTGIDTISLNPDSVIPTLKALAAPND